MARHLWREDIEKRASIRAEKDANPKVTCKELGSKFGVNTKIIESALEKTIDEWKALAETTPARISRRDLAPVKQAVQQMPAEGMPSKPVPAIALNPVPAPSSTHGWEYRAVIVRGRTQWNDVIYEQQGHAQGDWKPLAVKTFDDVLNLFGKDGWELAGMVGLSHGSAGFTGMYELAFKRKRA